MIIKTMDPNQRRRQSRSSLLSFKIYFARSSLFQSFEGQIDVVLKQSLAISRLQSTGNWSILILLINFPIIINVLNFIMRIKRFMILEKWEYQNNIRYTWRKNMRSICDNVIHMYTDVTSYTCTLTWSGQLNYRIWREYRPRKKNCATYHYVAKKRLTTIDIVYFYI